MEVHYTEQFFDDCNIYKHSVKNIYLLNILIWRFNFVTEMGVFILFLFLPYLIPFDSIFQNLSKLPTGLVTRGFIV